MYYYAEIKATGALFLGSLSILYLAIKPYSSLSLLLVSATALSILCRKLASGGSSFTYRKNLSGRLAIVTGAASGVGYQSAKQLASMGAHVVLAGRGIGKMNEAKENLVKEIVGGNCAEQLDVIELDLASFESIRAFVREFEKRFGERGLDILLNNAGVMMCPYLKTSDGIEMQFGTNHLGHFLLTSLLMPFLKKSKDKNPRIVNVSSMAHHYARKGIDYRKISNPSTYDPMEAYAMSKLANILYTNELQRRLSEENSNITVYSAHPGVIMTNLARHMFTISNPLLDSIFRNLTLLVTKTHHEGCLTSLYCCIHPNAVPGGYHVDCDSVSKESHASNLLAAKELWELSEKLINQYSLKN